MEAYLYQHHQNFILDPAYNCSYDSPIEISMLSQYQNGGDLSNASSCFSGCNSSEAIQESSIGLQQVCLDKKRKEIDDLSSLNLAQTKNTKELKSRKKKHNSVTMKEKSEGKKTNNKAKETKLTAKNTEEPPSGYIHVRARRGQATDSHSLAERVRRERISERMKKLQGLVPGCDNVIGKALVLDEIINYVQSLQNQVEFLSMKIASVNPILYDFGVGFEDYMSHVEGAGGMSQTIPSVIQNSHVQQTTFEGTSNNIQVIDPSYMIQFHGQDSNTFSQHECQDNSSSYLMQEELKNMCSFQ